MARKEMPYYSTSSGADTTYHVFADCPIGAEVGRADRASGIGPDDAVYPRCEVCEELDRLILDGRLWFHPRSGRARRSR